MLYRRHYFQSLILFFWYGAITEDPEAFQALPRCVGKIDSTNPYYHYKKNLNSIMSYFQGDHQSKVTFTSTEETVTEAKPIPDIRLVDGPSILVGRVQLLHRGQWRSVCTNSRK